MGDLTSNVSDIGIGEIPTKRVAKQIASALDYIHSKYVYACTSSVFSFHHVNLLSFSHKFFMFAEIWCIEMSSN